MAPGSRAPPAPIRVHCQPAAEWRQEHAETWDLRRRQETMGNNEDAYPASESAQQNTAKGGENGMGRLVRGDGSKAARDARCLRRMLDSGDPQFEDHLEDKLEDDIAQELEEQLQEYFDHAVGWACLRVIVPWVFPLAPLRMSSNISALGCETPMEFFDGNLLDP